MSEQITGASVVKLLAQAKQFHPSLLGKLAQPDTTHIAINKDNNASFTDLYRHWQQKYPEAGRAYWSARCWTLLIWQPIYLTVVAVHGSGRRLPLSDIHQHLNQGIIAGFNLSNPALQTDSEFALIKNAGEQLQHCCQVLLTQCQQAFTLRPRLAIRLAADTLLSALTNLPRLKPSIDLNTISNLADTWLLTLGWQEQSALMPISLANGDTHLSLNRKSCCFDYCRREGAVCATCPKQSLTERKARITQELSTHA